MVDRAKAVRLLDTLRAALSDLDRYQPRFTSEELESSADAQNMVLHALYRAIQATLDLAQHIVADEGLVVPQTYRAIFHSLEEAGRIDSELSARLANWAGLRNVIAHDYVDIDHRRIHAALAERDDLRRFAALVAQIVADQR